MRWFDRNLPLFNVPDGGGAAPTPATPAAEPAPAPTPTSPTTNGEPTAPAESQEIDQGRMDWVLNAFDPMEGDLDEESDVVEIPPGQPVEPVSGVPPVTPPVQTQEGQQPAPVAQPPVAAVPTPQPVPATPIPAAAQPAQAPTQTPQPAALAAAPVAEPEPQQILQQIADGVAQQQEVFTQALAESQYGLTQDVVAQLGLDEAQAKALSKLQAKVHVNVVSSMTQMFAKQLPAVVLGLLKAQDAHKQAENAFFDRWPQLKGDDKKQVLSQVMNTYRRMNPNAPKEEFINMTGAMACSILGVPVHMPAQPNPAVPPPPLAPRTPGPIVRQPNGLPAFAPAGTATAPPSAQPRTPVNFWDNMSRIMEADDQGHFDT